MKLYVGNDLHSSNNYLEIVDETGKRIFHRKLPNDVATIIGKRKRAEKGTGYFLWLGKK